MTRDDFEKMVAEEFPRAVPEKFRAKIKNVVFVVEREPSPEVRKKEGLSGHETLLGFYAGIPLSVRGEGYGVGITMPDTITLYQAPIEYEGNGEEAHIRRILRETIWHEVAHFLGMGEEEVLVRERKRDAI